MSTAAIRTGADRTLELLSRQVGRPLSEVETPVAAVDLDRLDANLRDLQSYADKHGIALWPHTKTHKSPEIGLRQLERAVGPGAYRRGAHDEHTLPYGRRCDGARLRRLVRSSTRSHRRAHGLNCRAADAYSPFTQR